MSTAPVIMNSAMRVSEVAIGKAEDALEIGEAVVAAEAGVVAEEQQHEGKGERLGDDGKYTPLMRERKAKKPNTKASRPGTSTTSSAAYQK